MERKIKVYIENIGCTRRGLDARRLSSAISRNDKYVITQSLKEADIIVVYTCAFYKYPEKESIRRLKELKKEKGKLIIGGCLGAVNPDITKKMGSEYFIPSNEEKIGDILKIKLDDVNFQNNTLLLNDRNKDLFNLQSVWHVKIASGCNENCTFCKIKNAVGSFKSKRPEVIFSEIKKGIENGYSKIQLEAENTGAYGIDLDTDINLPLLLKEILCIDNNFYIASIQDLSPKWLLKHIGSYIDILRKKRIKYILSPIQSGSQKILKLMNRDYEIKDVERIFKEIKKYVKLWTQVIVGFPGEAEEDFNLTISFLKKVEPDIIDVFLYLDNKPIFPSLFTVLTKIDKRQQILEKLFKEKIGTSIFFPRLTRIHKRQQKLEKLFKEKIGTSIFFPKPYYP